MRRILSEKNIVVLLFVMVCITFSLAHEDSKKMEQIYLGNTSSAAASLLLKPVEQSAVVAKPATTPLN